MLVYQRVIIGRCLDLWMSHPKVSGGFCEKDPLMDGSWMINGMLYGKDYHIALWCQSPGPEIAGNTLAHNFEEFLSKPNLHEFRSGIFRQSPRLMTYRVHQETHMAFQLRFRALLCICSAPWQFLAAKSP